MTAEGAYRPVGCNWRDPETDEVCANQPTRAVTSGCRHEHVATFGYCADHAAEFAAGTVGCWPCWQSVGADVDRVLLADRPLSLVGRTAQKTEETP